MKSNKGLYIFLLAEIAIAAWFLSSLNKKSAEHKESPQAVAAARAPQPMYVMTEAERSEFDRLSEEIDQLKREADKKSEEKMLRMIDLMTGGAAKTGSKK